MKPTQSMLTKTKKSYPRLITLLTTAVCASPAMAQSLQWSNAMSSQNNISTWLRTIMLAIMACFVMVSIILGALAFKGLATDGNWKDFWSKIAGAIGMFVTPIAIYWIANNSNI